jgi:hypothetical protein
MIKTNNQLSKVSKEEQLSLQSKLRGTAPVTPIETKVLGGNQDQAKMAGTPQQKQGVLKGAVKGTESLQTTLRQQQDRTQATETEADKSSAAGRLQNLTGLQDRVQAATQGILNQQQAQVAGVGQAKITDDPELDSLLNQFKTDPTNLELLTQINQKLGKTKVGEQLSPDQIKEMFNLESAQITEGLAETVQDDIFVGDLDLAAIGGLTQEELASLLNIPVDLISTLSVSGLRAEIDSQIKEQFNEVQNLERKISDVNLGPAERAEARRQLRDMGAVGIRSVESEMDKLADSLENAETVEFMGEPIDVQTLLDDSYLSGVAASYLNPETSKEWKDKFKAENPEMASWLDTHQVALADSIKNIDQGTQAYAQLQLDNSLLAKAPDGQDLPDTVMERIIPGWGTLQSSAYDKNQIPILKILNDPLKTNYAQNLTKALRDLDKVNPEIVTQLAGMTEDQLAKVGVLSNTSNWKSYMGYLKDQQTIKNLDKNDPDAVYKALFGPSATAKTHQSILEDYVAKINSGLFNIPIDPKLQMFLGTKVVNGKPVASLPKNPAELAKALSNLVGKPVGVNELLAGKTVNGFSQMSEAVKNSSAYNIKNPELSDLFTKLQPFYKEGTPLTGNIVSSVLKGNLPQLKLAIQNLPLSNEEKSSIKTSIVNAHINQDIKSLIEERQLPIPFNLINPVAFNSDRNKQSLIDQVTFNGPNTNSLRQVIEGLKFELGAIKDPYQQEALSKVIKQAESAFQTATERQAIASKLMNDIIYTGRLSNVSLEDAKIALQVATSSNFSGNGDGTTGTNPKYRGQAIRDLENYIRTLEGK